jgi:exopolysaccharide biosynthesis WecB/TagA/CpsF family protein
MIGEGFPRAFVVTAAGLLTLLDFASLLLAALLTEDWFSSFWSAPAESGAVGWSIRYLLVVTALLAAVVLHDKQFGARARRGDWSALALCYLTRFLLFVGAVLVIGSASGVLSTTPGGEVAVWLALSFLLASLARAVLASGVRRLIESGELTEVVAIVGAGSLADRLTQDLRTSKRASMHVLGVFDDDGASAQGTVAGTVDDLIEIGKTRHLDWIFVNLPRAGEQQLAAVVRRLKALAVPIALCPWNVGLGTPYQVIDYVGGALPVTVLVDRPARRWRAAVQTACQFLPRWITTLLFLPLSLAALWRPQGQARGRAAARANDKLSCELDDYDVESFVATARDFGQSRYGFVVTPNVDHLIRLHEDSEFRQLYAAARYVLLDSRFLANMLRMLTGRRLPVCSGSDITAKLLAEVVAVDDRIVVIGSNQTQMKVLELEYGFRNLAQFSPPMGFIRDPKAVEACLSFVEAHSPFRFCLLAVGAPQQEILAERLQARGVARGLVLCVGAAIDFVTGTQRRAPQWMQRAGLEWLFRLAQNPARLATRYLVRGPRVFGLLRKTEFVLRVRLAEPARGAAVAAAARSLQPVRLQPASVVEAILSVEPPLPEQNQDLVIVMSGDAEFGASRMGR